MTLKNSHSAPLSCAEFQEQLPDLFAAAGNSSIDDPEIAEHLKSCENCSALVRDLQYIADQAKQLLQPTHEPSDNVWKKIQEGLAADPSYATGPGKS
ncbi:hypothetical protein [Edaphobacter sp. 12200R-103]|jgi:hypothetical protein|uniref:hypothetical protein n=1 Tax=Edaphobacter sp. 12200R-103 TaxID=2703788 RepID=UPI00138C35F0|nr:hypothetical protein [Edaphobacter sp. 12200R-103]QHS50486.1 hypothetical protein GWR55_01025 [Edaphobacter sp. 12200R-103]